MELLNQILQLPERSLVNKKITKAFFKRNFDLTLSERKFIDDAAIILQIEWLASLKPEQINIPGYNAEQTIFDEIQIISVQTSDIDFDKNKSKIIEFIQKYIPYHLFLGAYNNKEFILNVSSKRINLNDSSKRTIEKSLTTENISVSEQNEKQKIFLSSLTFSNLDKDNLKTVYDSYSQCITALQTAQLTGTYSNRPIERSKQDIDNLEKIKKLESEIVTLQLNAKKETQLNTQVQINAEVHYRRSVYVFKPIWTFKHL